MKSLTTWSQELRRLACDCEGNVALLFGLTLPMLIGVAGLGIDSAAFYNQQSRMQSVADASALAIATEMRLYTENPATLMKAGEARVEARLVEAGIAHGPHTTRVHVNRGKGTAQVEISMTAEAFLPADIWGENPIVVSATAVTYGEQKLCVLGLHRNASDTIKGTNSARMTAEGCSVQSNSTDATGLNATDTSLVASAYTCTSGGYQGSASSYEPTPVTDCPQIPDPLEMRSPPKVGGCDLLDFKVDKGVHTIQPGHYCGGLTITNNAKVFAEPGIYVISGGKFEVGNSGKLRGDYVSFYFADDAATLLIKDQALVELGAPKDGPMAGMLFFEARSSQPLRTFEVSSAAARKLLGTIYLPKGILKSGAAGAAGNIADASAYTVIVANQIMLAGSNLVVNSDYAGTDVPVPAGVGPYSSQVRLSD